MKILYGIDAYHERSLRIAEIVQENSSVLDVCCGPGVLYRDFLKSKNVKYQGTDINEKFVETVKSYGAHAFVADLKSIAELPKADFVIMQSSLYHFVENPDVVLKKLMHAATKKVIIAEPIRNLSTSKFKVMRLLGKTLTRTNQGTHPQRFNEESLDQLMRQFGQQLEAQILIKGGREKIYVIKK